MPRTSRSDRARYAGSRFVGVLIAAGCWLDARSASAQSDEHALAPAGPTRAGHSPLELTVGLRAVHRSFEYHDPALGLDTLLSQKQPLAPALFAQAFLFPSAFGSRAALSNLGLAASYELALPTTAVFDEGAGRETKLTTHASELFLGFRGRLPLAAHELGLIAGYGQQRYTNSGDEQTPIVPDVSYEFARVALDASLRFDALTFGARLGTRFVGDTGGLRRDWFPHTKARALEAGLLMGYRVAPPFDVVVGLDLTRYWFDFNPIPKNADPRYVAGGAVDQYVSGWLGLRISLENQAPN